MTILTFSEAITKANELKTDKGKIRPKHILLGNGFSIAYNTGIFTYSSLLENANFSKDIIRKVFNSFKTKDFEQIIKVLQASSQVLKIYNNNAPEIKVLKKDAQEIKKELIKVLCSKHPERPSALTQEEYKNCAKFLSNFDRIFTLNYDLLLYWTLLQDKDGDKCIKKIDDGFRRGAESYLNWNVENAHDQNIYYLHGALHLLDNDFDLIKLEWSEWGSTIIEQITDGLAEGRFPLFVAEGTSKQKLSKITHNAYLSKCLDSFSQIGGSLFVYGHSLAENDNHILHLIPQTSKIENLFISLFGNPESRENKKIIQRANKLKFLRDEQIIQNSRIKPLNLYFYSTDSTKVWR